MTTRKEVLDFLAQRKLAIVGVSRTGKKFGNAAYKELTEKGYAVFPVHPEAQTIGGQRCWPSLRSLPEPVGGVVIVVPPSQTERVVVEAQEAGISRVWMQRGSESPKAVRYCEEKGMTVVQRECILMYAEPTAFFHRAHRWVFALLGKLPRE